MDRDDLSPQDVHDIYRDQDHIAHVISLELAIEVELAEGNLLSAKDFHQFAGGLSNRGPHASAGPAQQLVFRTIHDPRRSV